MTAMPREVAAKGIRYAKSSWQIDSWPALETAYCQLPTGNR